MAGSATGRCTLPLRASKKARSTIVVIHTFSLSVWYDSSYVDPFRHMRRSSNRDGSVGVHIDDEIGTDSLPSELIRVRLFQQYSLSDFIVKSPSFLVLSA